VESHGDAIIVRCKHVLSPNGDKCVNTVNVPIHSCIYLGFRELRGCMVFEREPDLYYCLPIPSSVQV
jgi:hypothetical protein